MIYKGARYCNMGCYYSLKEDRRCGLIYLAIHTSEGAYSVEDYSLIGMCCAYCLEEVPGRVKVVPPTWPKKENNG